MLKSMSTEEKNAEESLENDGCEICQDTIKNQLLTRIFGDGNYAVETFLAEDMADADCVFDEPEIAPPDLSVLEQSPADKPYNPAPDYREAEAYLAAIRGDEVIDDNAFTRIVKNLFRVQNGDDIWHQDQHEPTNLDFRIRHMKFADAVTFSQVYDECTNGKECVAKRVTKSAGIGAKVLSTDTGKIELIVLLVQQRTTKKIAGFILGGADAQHAYLNEIGITPEFQQAGLVGMLLRYFRRYIDNLGIKDIWLDTNHKHHVWVPAHERFSQVEYFLKQFEQNDEK